MDKPVLVVIGNGMAGVRLVEKLCELAPARYRIVVISDEAQPAYNRIMLTPVLAGEKGFTDIITHDRTWYERYNVTLIVGYPVTMIDREARILDVNGRQLSYDYLVMATGSLPFMPPLPGGELPGIHGFRNQQDVESILHELVAGQPAVVIGGGVLGIETAAALALRGMQVTLLHRGSHLMDQHLDPHVAGLLRGELMARGIETVLEAETVAYEADETGKVQSVKLCDGRTIPARRVIVAAGVRPNIALAQAAGLDCARGILVNDQLQTSDTHISAIGECCQLGEQTFGLVAPCWQQAETLAARLAGMSAPAMLVHDVPLRLKVTGIHLFCAGTLHATHDAEIHTTFDPFDGHYRRLLIQNNQLKGVLLWGDINDGPAYFARLGHPQSSLFTPEAPNPFP